MKEKILKMLEGLKELSSKNKILLGVIVVAIIAAIALAAYFTLHQTPPKPEPVKVQAPPPPPPPPPSAPEPEAPPVVEIPPPPPLPQLGESDSMVMDALVGLLNDKSLSRFLRTDRIIRNIVATVDNLPRREAPLRVVPVKRAPGRFLTSGGEGDLTIGKKNAARYNAYVKIAEVIDTKSLVELYVHLYPLFQDAYAELGYPKKYFNDRLLVALDDLLAAPDIKEPVKLVQPKVFYQFADPDLEGRSIGQRIMMRVGSKNEAALKARLDAFKQELLRHMSEQKIVNAGLPASYVAEVEAMKVAPTASKAAPAAAPKPAAMHEAAEAAMPPKE